MGLILFNTVSLSCAAILKRSQFFYWNMNYHVEHHMYAAVPYYNLPKLRKAIRGLFAT